MTQTRVPGGHQDAPTRTVDVGDGRLAYRELGPRGGRPLVALTHLGANLDGWDPRVVDGLARTRHVILLGYRGVGGSAGPVRDRIEAMAADVVDAVTALGHDRVDLLGLSMGGMVAQSVVAQAPGLVHGLVLAGSGPAGGPGITRLTRVMVAGTLHAVATGRAPQQLLFFTRSPAGRSAARDHLGRLRERTWDRERAVGPAVLRAQLAAVHRWGAQAAPEPVAVPGPVLVLHGDHDRLVPVANAVELVRLIPGATLRVLPDAGHGAVFQHHREVVAAVDDLLGPPPAAPAPAPDRPAPGDPR